MAEVDFDDLEIPDEWAQQQIEVQQQQFFCSDVVRRVPHTAHEVEGVFRPGDLVMCRGYREPERDG